MGNSDFSFSLPFLLPKNGSMSAPPITNPGSAPDLYKSYMTLELKLCKLIAFRP